MTGLRVLAITGIRSEYSLQRPIFEAVQAHPDLDLALVVTGAHLSPHHGGTVRDIEADGFNILTRVESLLYSDHDAARLKGAAIQLLTLAHTIDGYRPDWLLAPCDREEAATVALCGAYMNIATAHYGAGDRVVGNVDDMVRHTVSRLSHLLLTTHELARERLIRSGEEPWRVHTVGHSGIDRLRTTPKLGPSELACRLGTPALESPYVVVIQHSISSEIADAGEHMRATLGAILDLEIQVFISYPSTDAGSQSIIREIDAVRELPNCFVFRNIPDLEFVNLLRGAAVLVGNSSLGLLEAPYLGLPVVNVGRRQGGRFHVDNVFFVPPTRDAIRAQLSSILNDVTLRARLAVVANPFGDGFAGDRVANLLATTPVDERLLNKDLTY